MGTVPPAVPSAVPRNAAGGVPVNKTPQRKPYKPPTGSQIAPKVPSTPKDGQTPPSPKLPQPAGRGRVCQSGSPGAPTVPPMGGALFTPGPIDSHYTNTNQGNHNPYKKVNNPPTRGMFTRIQDFINGIDTSQDKDNAGWKVRHPQQRTSHMLNTLPPVANGYSPETYTPAQQPQAVRYNRIDYPVIGSDPYGTGVLNTDTYGAGQTAGGIGGNNYTPAPGPPATNSTAGGDTGMSGMPTWG